MQSLGVAPREGVYTFDLEITNIEGDLESLLAYYVYKVSETERGIDLHLSLPSNANESMLIELVSAVKNVSTIKVSHLDDQGNKCFSFLYQIINLNNMRFDLDRTNGPTRMNIILEYEGDVSIPIQQSEESMHDWLKRRGEL